MYLLDAALKPVPVGVVGDVYYGGGAAASARLPEAASTATRFVADPFAAQPGSRLYRTGERGVWDDAGLLVLLPGATASRQPAPTGPGPAEPPGTATERTLAAILAAVLDAGEVGRSDEFFSLGGDSICAVRVAAQARDAGLPLTPRMVFEHPVLHELAAALDAKSESETDSADTHHAPMSASGLSADELAELTSSWGHQP